MFKIYVSVQVSVQELNAPRRIEKALAVEQNTEWHNFKATETKVNIKCEKMKHRKIYLHHNVRQTVKQRFL